MLSRAEIASRQTDSVLLYRGSVCDTVLYCGNVVGRKKWMRCLRKWRVVVGRGLTRELEVRERSWNGGRRVKRDAFAWRVISSSRVHSLWERMRKRVEAVCTTRTQQFTSGMLNRYEPDDWQRLRPGRLRGGQASQRRNSKLGKWVTRSWADLFPGGITSLCVCAQDSLRKANGAKDLIIFQVSWYVAWYMTMLSSLVSCRLLVRPSTNYLVAPRVCPVHCCLYVLCHWTASCAISQYVLFYFFAWHVVEH